MGCNYSPLPSYINANTAIPLLNSEHGWEITSHIKQWLRLFLPCLISVNPYYLKRQLKFISYVAVFLCILRTKHNNPVEYGICQSFANVWFVITLTHWGRVTHIWVSKQTIIGSDNSLSPGRRQAIIWINARISLIGTLGTNFSEFLFEIRIFSFKKMGLNVSSAKWRPFCLGLNVLSYLAARKVNPRKYAHSGLCFVVSGRNLICSTLPIYPETFTDIRLIVRLSRTCEFILKHMDE